MSENPNVCPNCNAWKASDAYGCRCGWSTGLTALADRAALLSRKLAIAMTALESVAAWECCEEGKWEWVRKMILDIEACK